MIKFISLILNFITLYIRLAVPGGARAIAAENIALRKQLIAMSHQQKRAPKLTTVDKIIFGILTSMISVKRLSRISIVLKPATLLKFHKALIQRKYNLLFSNKSHKKPGPKAPDQTIIDAIVEMKKRNIHYGYRRIGMQISNAFCIAIDKDIVRRVLNKHFKNIPPNEGSPSWLTFIGHMKDSLWSVDLFRCESINLKTHWVMLVMDQFTRRIIGFAVHGGEVSGINLCYMFNKIISHKILPKYLSSDNDPLFQFHRWHANLRVLDIEEIKSVPHVPTSHPFVERLIGSIRRELLDKIFFWTATDLQNKLELFQRYYNEDRCHLGIGGISPLQKSNEKLAAVISLNDYRWKKHCHGLFQLPISA
jgi:transposase InsO family protein